MQNYSDPNARQAEVRRQVSSMFAQSASFQALPIAEQARVLDQTSALVETMATNRMQQRDPYASPTAGAMAAGGPLGPLPPGAAGGGGGADPAKMTGGATNNAAQTITKGDFGAGIKTGVNQIGELVRQVNFPAFVTELVQGVFQSVVDASIKQMKAYGELVQSVTMSLNEFRDQNVTANQGRDHLVSKYPKLFQVNINQGQPTVGMRPEADDSQLPDFQADLGLSEPITSLDEETIEQKLVLAARNDLARSRQRLLATMVLMGINRIVVTDGKIKAKMKINFHARDTQVSNAQTFDYNKFGDITTVQSSSEGESKSNYDFSRDKDGGYSYTGDSSRYMKGEYQYTQTPVIYMTSMDNTTTNAEVQAQAELMGEVSLGFKSDVVDLNRFVDPEAINQIQRMSQSAGRGAPAPNQGAAAAAPANTANTPAPTRS